ncbi:MAG: hypothetical protein CL853_04925 [Crocinitomicaceae bacterium]|nr:hypothetical protein [Crocinitomicaceae bacterium]
MGVIQKIHSVSIFLVVFFLTTYTYSQDISTDIIEKQGGKFYKHIVKKGETSFGIAKLYSVDLNLLFDNNPEAEKGLQLNQVIYIPIIPTDESQNKTTPINIDSTNSIIHIVSSGDTYWSISKKYSVSIDQLKKVNPNALETLQIGQSIVIPSSKIDTTNIVTPIVKNPINPLGGPCDSIFIHKVKKRETFYSISKMYNVTISSIKSINNGLLEGLKKGEEIRILVKKVDCDETSTKDLSLLESTKDSLFNFSKDSITTVSLLLPLLLDENDSILANCPPLQKCPLNVNSIQSTHFYNGVLMAIDSLKKAGLNVKLNVYDTKNNRNAIDEILADSNFIKSHLVIGPIYMRNIKLVTDFCNKHSIHVICPVAIPNQALFNNKFLTRITPSKQTMVTELAKYNLKQPKELNRILVVNKMRKNDLSYANAFESYYNSNLPDSLDSLTSISLTSSSNLSAIKKHLKADVENIIIVPSNDIGFVSNFMTKLSGLVNTYEYRKHSFCVYGMEKWKDMQTIDEKYKNSFNLHIPLSGRVNYHSSSTIDFIKKHRSKFNFDPEKFSFIAFDIAFNALKGLMLYENNLDNYYSKSAKNNGYFFKINISQVDSTSGYENKGVHIYRYNNHELIRLD